MKLPISHVLVSLSIFFFIYIYKKFLLFWMYLMIWNIVFFFQRYNISLISWNCKSQIWLFLTQSSFFIYIYHFFFSGCISWYEISKSSSGDIIFHGYRDIVNLIFVSLSFNLHSYIYISFFLFRMYLTKWNMVFFFFGRYNISLISSNCQSRIWLSRSQSSFSDI